MHCGDLPRCLIFYIAFSIFYFLPCVLTTCNLSPVVHDAIYDHHLVTTRFNQHISQTTYSSPPCVSHGLCVSFGSTEHHRSPRLTYRVLMAKGYARTISTYDSEVDRAKRDGNLALCNDLSHECITFYRRQRSCGKVMFLHLSVSHSVHRGRADMGETPPNRHLTGRQPPPRHPSRHTPQADTLAGTRLRQTPPSRHPPADILADTLPRQTPSPGRHQHPLGRHPPPPWQRPPADTLPLDRHPPADGYCSGQYASYWNAFLFCMCALLKVAEFPKLA